MIQNIFIRNLGPIADLKWGEIQSLNLLVGRNGTGKTFLLKSLYSTTRALELYKRGNDNRSFDEILGEKIYWTFQPSRGGIGRIVRRGGSGPLSVHLKIDKQTLEYSFGSDTDRKLQFKLESNHGRKENSIFLPAKEVLSLFHVIEKSRHVDRVFGFDDTYLDLVQALKGEPTKGQNYENFADSRRRLENLLEGRLGFENNDWFYRKGKYRFDIHSASEGFKKISILDRLLGNRYLGRNSIIFIDEPESALHPRALVEFLDILFLLSRTGLQVFIASHSYFVVKKLRLIAVKHKIEIPCVSFEKEKTIITDLRTEMPDNEIISGAVKLYEEEVELIHR